MTIFGEINVPRMWKSKMKEAQAEGEERLRTIILIITRGGGDQTSLMRGRGGESLRLGF